MTNPSILSERATRTLAGIAIAGSAIAVAGTFVSPERAWPNILLAAYYVLGLGLAGLVFIAFQYVSNAGWSVAIRRVPEAMTNILPVSSALILLTLLGVGTLYEWSNAERVASDHFLHEKSGWLNVSFFVVRTVIVLIVWMAFAYLIVVRSRRQDNTADISFTNTNKKLSAGFLVVFALTFTLASMDWVMSIEPKWYSTIFGVYNFCGLLLNGLATIAVLVILLRRWGPLAKVVTDGHLHDLGKLIFAFSTFWMYIWFSQYLLIWYANIPEEVVYYVHREQGSWLIFTGLNVLFNWMIPFAVLLPQWTKRNEGLLLKVSVIIMIGHWIDLFWMILPPFLKTGPEVGIWEVAPMAAALSVFVLVTLRSFAGVRAVPTNDPYLIESLHHTAA